MVALSTARFPALDWRTPYAYMQHKQVETQENLEDKALVPKPGSLLEQRRVPTEEDLKVFHAIICYHDIKK